MNQNQNKQIPPPTGKMYRLTRSRVHLHLIYSHHPNFFFIVYVYSLIMTFRSVSSVILILISISIFSLFCDSSFFSVPFHFIIHCLMLHIQDPSFPFISNIIPCTLQCKRGKCVAILLKDAEIGDSAAFYFEATLFEICVYLRMTVYILRSHCLCSVTLSPEVDLLLC